MMKKPPPSAIRKKKKRGMQGGSDTERYSMGNRMGVRGAKGQYTHGEREQGTKLGKDGAEPLPRPS